MFARLLTRPLRYIFAAIALAGCLLLFVNQSLTAVQAARQQITAGSTYVVNSTADTPDADILTPACADASGHCTLRAAIMQANFATGLDTITLPSGIYTLTRPGNDDAAILGDLDILDDVTIQGAGSGTTIVDGNGAVTGDRVFQILASAKHVTLSGLTIQHGRKEMDTYNAGGGLYWDGGRSQLHLHDVVVDGNIATDIGGGLYLNYSDSGDIVDMDQIVIRTNTVTVSGGGGLGVNFGDYATFDLRNSRVYSNAASIGGGLYFQDLPNISVHSVRVETTEIYSNVAGSSSGGLENQDLNHAANPIMLLDSRLYNNHAGYYGGAITNVGTLVISNTTLSANHAGYYGGAIVNNGTLVISNTTLTANSASITGTNSASTQGGALFNTVGSATINQSTLNGNSAASGGAIYTEHYSNTALTLNNSTLSDNTASQVGGGIDAEGGRINLINSTVSDNRVEVPFNSLERGLGGGVFITGTAIAVVQNALLADNIDHENHIHGSPPRADDCYDLSASRNLYASAQNLIEAASYCNIDGNTSGVISGQSPQLGPLQNNGGSTWTRVPLAGSPAIDQGDNTACPPTDQRGWRRPIGSQCDIGAVEYSPYAINLPIVLR